jgi:WD40 repeat protein
MKLTQHELAVLLAVSKQDIEHWERGLYVPTPEQLKRLTVLALQRHAFPPAQAREQAEQLWLCAGQQADFAVFWNHAQRLAQQTAVLVPPALLTLKHAAVQTTIPQQPPNPPSRFDWGEALAVHTLYGRDQELSVLTRWMLQEQCQVVNVLGMGGMGKSVLVVTLMHQLAPAFQAAVFRSLRDAPACQDLLADCLQVLLPQPLLHLPADADQRIDVLLECLQTQRCLLVLDNLETLLQEQDTAGRMRSGYEDYATLLQRVAQTPHQSCLLITSRELPATLEHLESSQTNVRTLRLGGLALEACEQLLDERELVSTVQERECLSHRYEGNPLALKIVSETIADVFGGEISSFLEQEVVIFSSLRDLLAEQWSRLSPLEQALLIWLAIMREPLGTVELHELLFTPQIPVAEGQIGAALEALHRRSLIEQGMQPATFTLQSVVLEYVTEVLVEQISEQIQHGVWQDLISYALKQAGAKDDVQQTQERLIVAPILLRLQTHFQRAGALEEWLLRLLDQQRTWDQQAQGYGPANLIALLYHLRGHLRGLDLSQLSIRDANLQGVEMQDARLCGTTLRDTLLTEAMHSVWSVTVSRMGTFWAAGSRQGDVRVWREEGRLLHLCWLAHADTIFNLAFSPDERTLATASWDGTVKLWDLEQGALLWSGQHLDAVRSLVFSPTGDWLISGASDGTIYFWNPASGALMQTLRDEGGVVYSLACSPDGRLLASGSLEGSIRLWQIHDNTQPATCVQIIRGHTNWVHSLAFAPDGASLVSGSWDKTVKLWEVPGGRLLQTLTGHTERVNAVAWSPDGRTVASAGNDSPIWLWDVKHGSYRARLQRHTNFIYGLAFTPDSRRLLSGSEDGTLGVWDVEKGQCVRIMQSYAVAMYSLAWNPAGSYLATGGSDRLVLIWDVTNQTPPRVFPGHRWTVFGVAWSPDGRLLASSGRDNAVRVWNPDTGNCLQILYDPDYVDTMFYGMTWSPDGRFLASGTTMHGIQVWNVETGQRCWVGLTSATRIRCVVWSPDGSRLISGGDDGSLCVWRASDGTLLARWQQHHGGVVCLACSPDGKYLASGGSGRADGELLVWKAESGELLRKGSELAGSVFALAWSKDGKRLVSGSNNGKLQWWDVDHWKLLHSCQGHQQTIYAVQVSPDGRLVASCGDDSTIKIWDLETAELVRTLRRDRPYERLNITGIQGVTEAQKSTLRALGAIEDTPHAEKEDGDGSVQLE